MTPPNDAELPAIVFKSDPVQVMAVITSSLEAEGFALNDRQWGVVNLALHCALDGSASQRAEVERLRMQLAGCSTAAAGYWKEGDSIHEDYRCAALSDVAQLRRHFVEERDRADRLAAELAQAQARVEELERQSQMAQAIGDAVIGGIGIVRIDPADLYKNPPPSQHPTPERAKCVCGNQAPWPACSAFSPSDGRPELCWKCGCSAKCHEDQSNG